MSWQCTVIEAGGGNNDDIAISNDDALIRRRSYETANVGYILGTAALRSHQLFDQVMVPWVLVTTAQIYWTKRKFLGEDISPAEIFTQGCNALHRADEMFANPITLQENVRHVKSSGSYRLQSLAVIALTR